MRYELMHRDILAAVVEISEDGALQRIVSVRDRAHFPFGTAPKEGSLDPTGLKRWWDNRRIPMSRADLENVRGIVLPKEASSLSLLLACNGLSLSDSFWIRKEGEETSFEELNFFTNDYSYDLGDVLVGKKKDQCSSLMSPDSTSEGNLKKRWKTIDGDRVLLKSGTPPYCYEVFNEVIASRVCAWLGIPHVEYWLVNEDGAPYSACSDFVSYSQDFVTAYMIYNGAKKHNDESLFSFFLRRYQELGVEEPRRRLEEMLLVDFLLGNEDRHLNNFGLIRDARTLRFVGVAPIFDTGSSLGFDRSDDALSCADSVPWKPFFTHDKQTQLDYIEDLNWVNPEALSLVPSLVELTCERLSSYLPRSRADAIVSFVTRRVDEVAKRFGMTLDYKELSALDERILGYARARGGVITNAQTLADEIGIAWITAARHLQSLCLSNHLVRVGSRKTGHWELTNKNRRP